MVAVILGMTEDFWRTQIMANQENSVGLALYMQPVLTVGAEPMETPCGDSRKLRGLFYCAADGRIYFDVRTVSLLVSDEDEVADFAVAYIIAHEVAHSIQSSVYFGGKKALFDALDEDEKTTVKFRVLAREYELQADCLAGAWTRYASDYGVLDPGDIEEALALAARGASGDTSLGRLRAKYFRVGLARGRPGDCDVFTLIRRAGKKLGPSLSAVFSVVPVLVTRLGPR
jgi:predicted metalloprotease